MAFLMFSGCYLPMGSGVSFQGAGAEVLSLGSQLVLLPLNVHFSPSSKVNFASEGSGTRASVHTVGAWACAGMVLARQSELETALDPPPL